MTTNPSGGGAAGGTGGARPPGNGPNGPSRMTPLTGVLMTDGHGGLVVRRVRVRVSGGVDRGREALLEAGTLLVGTHPDNDLVVRDPSVGKYHLELALVAAGVRVRDLGADGGTLVAGLRVATTIVPTGTEVLLGRTTLQLLTADVGVPVVASERTSFGPVLGQTMAMREVFALLERISPTDAPVLLEGERGCGRTLVAKAIHASSRFAASPMVVVDFSVPPQERPSLQHIAQRSDTFTLLLENIDLAPGNVAGEMLNLYERREEGVLDARIVATAAPGLRMQTSDARSRRELLSHVTAVRIPLPSLRARVDDIPVLVRQFVREICGVEPKFEDGDFDRIRVREYPGNVKELRQMVVAALAAEPTPRAQLPRAGLARAKAALVLPLNARPKPPNPRAARDALLLAFERDWLANLHTRCNGDLAALSRETTLSRADLLKQLKRFGIGDHGARASEPPSAPVAAPAPSARPQSTRSPGSGRRATR